MIYGLYPWTWDDAEKEHRPPEGAVCAIDFRPTEEQAKQSQSSGWGFFGWPSAAPSDRIDLGDGDCRTLQPTTSQRDELRRRLSLSSAPAGATLVDALSDILGPLSDPSGAAGPRPAMPTTAGDVEIHLANHSRVWQSRYEADQVLSVAAKGRANRQRDVWRGIMKDALDVSPEHAAKVLGGILRMHGIPDGELDDDSPAKRDRWAVLLTARDRQRAGGQFRPKRPKTSFSESFNKADSDTLGPDLTWAEVTGDADIVSNKASTSTTGFVECRAEHDVSSVNHYAQIVIHQTSTSGGDNHLAAPAARFAAAARTFYSFAWFATGQFLYKTVSGTYTIIGSTTETPAGLPATWKTDPNGSTIRGLQNGVQKVSVTDTSIAGNTRGGFWLYRASGVQVLIDDFLVDDGLSSGAAGPVLFHSHFQNQGWR